jgi:Ca2+-binding EF-hand superfamily protein
MRAAVFALLDKDGNVDVNNFDKRLAMFNDDWLDHYSSSIFRPNLDTPGPAAVKALQAEFVRTARKQAGDAAREEIQALYKANPDKIPASLRED